MNDELRAWLAPLYAAAKERGFELSAEILISCKPPEGQLTAPLNWLVFGQLLIQRLGWEDDYPHTP